MIFRQAEIGFLVKSDDFLRNPRYYRIYAISKSGVVFRCNVFYHDIPLCIYYVSEYFVLKMLYNSYISFVHHHNCAPQGHICFNI